MSAGSRQHGWHTKVGASLGSAPCTKSTDTTQRASTSGPTGTVRQRQRKLLPARPATITERIGGRGVELWPHGSRLWALNTRTERMGTMCNHEIIELRDHPHNLCDTAVAISGPREPIALFKCEHGITACLAHCDFDSDGRFRSYAIKEQFKCEHEAREALFVAEAWFISAKKG